MDKILQELKKLKDIFKEEIDFSVGDVLKGKIRLLTSEEETEVHSFSMAYDQGLAYLCSVKRETICRGIISLNGRDLPDVIDSAQRHIWLRDGIRWLLIIFGINMLNYF